MRISQRIHENATAVFAEYEQRANAYPEIAAQLPELRADFCKSEGRAYFATRTLADRVEAADEAAAWRAQTDQIRAAVAPFADEVRALRIFVDGDNRDTRWDPHGLNHSGWTEGTRPGSGDIVVWYCGNTNNTVFYYLPRSPQAEALAAAVAPFAELDNRPLHDFI